METKNSYNSDFAHRDLLIFGLKDAANYDISYFESLTLDTLKSLLSLNFISKDDPVQNGNLCVGDLLEFMLKYPNNTFAQGYVVSINREDYRTSLEGLIVKAPFDDKQRADFFFAMNGCDELSQDEGELRAWWD